ncbi:7a-methyl-1,5-dioxo-octahydro-1H-inden-4-yl [Seminavis robusta]|uniref:7a-methyl-1,5-dioxo-octahydro-1H-inden-4-yl n=1 Tax=Seminavis robusta TaxID=568900 RepID=A0A9N8DB46_9STRA|nr:7a-methyl-1,5-dioxo-octahydro-1H-inden-4-yl [Seminavis robusta]|eukprot:Sro65_g036780.1 7a-methyl-1,5-dioxo-octahydro-1H-inden-4-yl (1291) ;mRNA; r:72736-76695
MSTEEMSIEVVMPDCCQPSNSSGVLEPFHGQPRPHGQPHPTLQQVDALAHDVESLRRNLGVHDPLLNWQVSRHEMNLCDIRTWFPNDDHVAFYSPAAKTTDIPSYDRLTYRQLHKALDQCPSFAASPTSDTNVAIVLPVDHMAHTAMALLSVISVGAVAVPLDPRMPTFRVLEAMQQLDCAAFVASQSILLEGKLPLLEKQPDGTYKTSPALMQENSTEENRRLVEYFTNDVKEIRMVDCGVCGRLDWTILEKTGTGDEGIVWAVQSSKLSKNSQKAKQTTNPQKTAMLLRTSGTTNKPKVVPISHSHLAFAATGIASALALKRDDCNCNSMPFYHIGGISANLLAVLISGGSVIMAGPLTDPDVFLDHIETTPGKDVTATWYYAGPSMHKAILLMAESRWEANFRCLPNNLRFVRSASAHLNHDMALRLSRVFECQVIPTYGMSEAMPICSSAPIDVRFRPPCEVIDSVGYSVGTSIRILDPETDEVLEYGSDQVGEISVKGPGVISHYVGLDVTKTHTPDGWLKTGDRGTLDRQGRLFIKGRSKEMIKRGGEQVWPNEIDDVVEKVAGVATAVTFGVPNELWGEEVAVAVVLSDGDQIDNEAYIHNLENQIMETCRSKLDDLSMPQQIKFLPSTSCLLKGSTGKYIRSKMASHLGITAVDTGALRVLESVGQFKKAANLPATPTTVCTSAFDGSNSENNDVPWWDSTNEDGRRVMPSDALNGLRFLVACVVVGVHVGQYPNLSWVKLQAYQPNMMIFFGIGGFQIACSVARSVKERWASFVGSKIGSLHTLFVLAQLFTLPSYILFFAFDENGNMKWDMTEWIKFSIQFLFATITGMGHGFDVNKFTWFQSTFYMFLIMFPFLDDFLRRQTLKWQGILLVLFGILAAGIWGLLYLIVPSDIFWGPLYPVGWSIVTWLPLLVAGMLAAYFFRRIAEYYLKQRNKDLEERNEAQPQSDDPDTLLVEDVAAYSKIWGWATDVCSFILLLFAIAVAASPNCLCVHNDTIEAMRPGEPLPEEECSFSDGREDYRWICGITHEEWINVIQPDPNHIEYGRFPTMFGGAIGYLRTIAPLLLFWIAAMGFGNGYTAKFFSSRIMTRLAPLGYPVYLLHMGTARYYWIATRGWVKQDWWELGGEIPFPVQCISLGVRVCSFVSKCVKCITCQKAQEQELENDDSFDGQIKVSTYNQVKTMVRGLTGVDVNRSIKLKYLGLDSLGATALLGMLRASVPAAKNLTIQQLQECETVGCLSDFLDESSSLISGDDTRQTGSGDMESGDSGSSDRSSNHSSP